MTTGIPLSPTGGTSHIRTSAAVREARQFIKEAFAGQDLGGVHFPDGEVSFSALSDIWTGKGGHPAVLATAASRMKHMAWTDPQCIAWEGPEDSIEPIQNPGFPNNPGPTVKTYDGVYLPESLWGNKDHDGWLPAAGGQEQPINFNGRRYLYVYNPATGKHGYLNLDTDIMEDEDWTPMNTASRTAAVFGETGWAYWDDQEDMLLCPECAKPFGTGVDPVGNMTLGPDDVCGQCGKKLVPDESMTASRREAWGPSGDRHPEVDIRTGDVFHMYADPSRTLTVTAVDPFTGEDSDSVEFNDSANGPARMPREYLEYKVWSGVWIKDAPGFSNAGLYAGRESEVTRREAGAFRVGGWDTPGWIPGNNQVGDRVYVDYWGVDVPGTIVEAPGYLPDGHVAVVCDGFNDNGNYQAYPPGQVTDPAPFPVSSLRPAGMSERRWKAARVAALDDFTQQHLNAWLDRQFYDENERAEAESMVTGLFENDPEWAANHSWSELYDIAKTISAPPVKMPYLDPDKQRICRKRTAEPAETSWAYKMGYQDAQNGIPAPILDAAFLAQLQESKDAEQLGWSIPYLDAWVKGHAKAMQDGQPIAASRRTAAYKIGDQVQWSDAFASRPGLDSALDGIGSEPLTVQEVKSYTTGDALYGVGTMGGEIFWVEPSDLKPYGQVTGARPDDPDMHGGGYFEEVSPLTAARRLAWIAQQQYEAFESNVKGFINSFPSGSVVKRYASDCFARLVADLHRQWPWISDIQMGSYDWPDEGDFGVDPMDAAAIRDAIANLYSSNIDGMMAAASRRTAEPNYEESKHPRANDGKFTSGPGGGGGKADDSKPKDKAKDKPKDKKDDSGSKDDGSTLDDEWVPEEEGDEPDTKTGPEYEGADTGELKNPAKAANKGLETINMFMKDGKWNPERQKLHAQAESDILEGVTPVDNPVFILMGGGPAAGKSTMVNTGALTLPDNMASVNSDEIKTGDKRFKNFKGLPEYKTMADAGDERAAAFCHEESSTVAKSAMAKALGQNMNTLLDGTGDGGLEGVKKKCDAARRAGHKVTGHYAIIDADEGVRRATERAKKTGRKVPEDYIRETYANIYRDLPQAVAAGCFDELTLWDTGEKGKATPMLEVRDGKVTIHDKEAVAKHFGDIEWQTKSKQSQARIWRKSSLMLPLVGSAGLRAPQRKTSTAAWSNSVKRSRMRAMPLTSPQTTGMTTPLAGMMKRAKGQPKMRTAGSTLEMKTGIPIAPMRKRATSLKTEAADPPEWAFNWGDRDYDQATAEDAPEKREGGLPVGLGKTSGYDFDVFDGWDLQGHELRPKRG